ncbi:MAG: hypothetical protein JW870_02420 [Candidatus Delongbacteria bacterium]|nr:hypothetical protein [Candidatus Delongbacteria bacterium]
MIEKIANNKYNTETLNLNPIDKIKEKLDYYRTLFNKTHDLPTAEFEKLKLDIKTFFNLIPGGYTEEPPQGLIRISNNNRILEAQGKELSYLTDISQLLAPPIECCNFGRCNIPKQQVLYCAVNEAGAYWETKPQNGDVITISHFELKPNSKVNCNVVRKEKTKDPKISHQLQEVYYLLEDFFIDVYSLEVSKDRLGDYLFSGLLSSELLFYPVVSDNNIEAIIYPSVQKKMYGQNFAIRNDLILERYNLIGVETRFILDEYENLDPTSDVATTDQLIGSFGTTAFDFNTGKILYNEKADEIFKLFRELQTGKGKQFRFDHPDTPKNIAFNLTPSVPHKKEIMPNKKTKMPRNHRIDVIYQDGTRINRVKYKKVLADIESGKCRITKH